MKVRIKNLPKGFSLVNGKVYQEKREGGRTGSQDSSYGLVTLPTPYSGDITTFGDFGSPYGDINNTLGPVPRDEANLEAEVGETTLTDMNNDGDFELYNIGGKRHTHGGTPLNLPPQSFIFSDTRSMKLDKYELAEMGIDSKKKLTPAKVSKNFPLNKYISVLNNPHSDKISRETAEYMLQKNKESLSQLAFLQEAKKKFEDGVPLAAYPYLTNQGIDPLQFTQEIEGLTKAEAEQKMMMQMPVEQREKIMKLKALMQQAEKQAQIAEAQHMEETSDEHNLPVETVPAMQNSDPNVEAMMPPPMEESQMAFMRSGGQLPYFQNGGTQANRDTISAYIQQHTLYPAWAVKRWYPNQYLMGEQSLYNLNNAEISEEAFKRNAELLGLEGGQDYLDFYGIEYDEMPWTLQKLYNKLNKPKKTKKGYHDRPRRKAQKGFEILQDAQIKHDLESGAYSDYSSAPSPVGGDYNYAPLTEEDAIMLSAVDKQLQMNQHNQDLLEQMMAIQNDQLTIINNEMQIDDLWDQSFDAGSSFTTKTSRRPGYNSEQEFIEKVIEYKKQIEEGNAPPQTDDPAYVEAYNQIYGGKTDELVKNQEDATKDAIINNSYIINKFSDDDESGDDMYTELLRKLSRMKEGQDNPYAPGYDDDDITNTGYKDPQRSGYQLDYQNMDSPYYVGSAFATGDTLDTLKEGGESTSLPKAQGGVEIDERVFPIKLTDGTIINTMEELNTLKTERPDVYTKIETAYIDKYYEAERKAVDVDDAVIENVRTDHKGYDDWSAWYMSDDPAAVAYRERRYQAYVVLSEKNGKEPLSEDDYHKNYAVYQRTTDAFNKAAENDPKFRDNPNWDSEHRWEESEDGPCASGEKGCRESEDGTVWRVSEYNVGPGWKYNEEFNNLGLTDENGDPIEGMDAEMITHMQNGMNSGIMMSKLDEENIDFTVFSNEDFDDPNKRQILDETGASVPDGVPGDNTMFNSEATYTLEEGCTNAAEIQTQCEEQGGTFTPWDPETKTGCTCEGELIEKEEEPIPEPEPITPAIPPEPEFWLQDELGIANAMDAKFSLKKYYPWAPKYAEHLIDPTFKDPTREIAAIGEQAVIAADSAAAFSGPQRAAAVQAKAQGKAAAQIADTMNKVQSDNITIANTIAGKNAEIKYKTQVLNNNETKQLYDNTMLTEQNYDNALRKANKEITSQLQNAYTNMANTYNMNTLYPNFNVHPETGGMIHITNPKEFNKDPNYVAPETLSQQYIDFRNSFPTNTPQDSIPTYTEWYNITHGGNQKQNSDADYIKGISYPDSVDARRGREMRLAKSGMELRSFFKGGEY